MSDEPGGPAPTAADGGVITAKVEAHSRVSGNSRSPRRLDWQVRAWRALSRRPRAAIVVGIALAILFGVTAAGTTLKGPTVYTSKTVMLIDDPYKLATAGDNGEFINLSALRVKYASLIPTSAIAGPVARRTGLPVTEVQTAVSGNVPLQSLLLDVNAAWSNSAKARQLSKATADEVTAYVKQENATYDIPPNDRFTLTTLDPAAPATASKPSNSRALAVGAGFAVLGFLIGFCLTQLVRNRKILR